MARETKIGIALMVLLVGVFGFMVYKKWNSRQPTAIAAAAETPPAGTEADDAAKPQADATDADSLPPEPMSEIATADPFARPSVPAADSVPPRQAEPATDFTPEPFARESASKSLASNADPFAGTASDPPRQAEPMASGGEPEFAEPAVAASESVDPFGETTITTTEPPSANQDPFTAATTATLTATPAETVETAQSTSVEPADDPFADATTAAVEPAMEPLDSTEPQDPTDSDLMPSVPATAAADTAPPAASESDASPFADKAFVEDEAFADVKAKNVAASPRQVDADPFAESQAATTSTPVATTEPERLFGDDTEGEEFGNVEPSDAPPDTFETVGAAESSFVSAQPSAAASGERSMPAEQGSRSPFVVVAENDSYWTISKRVYGTPAYFHALAKYNAARIKDPNRLKPGMKVLTPEPQELAERFPNLVARSAPADSGGETQKQGLSWDANGTPVYRVGNDETLTGIAQAHLGRASRWVQIYEMNRKVVPDAKSLRPGTVLRLPADASRVRLVPES